MPKSETKTRNIVCEQWWMPDDVTSEISTKIWRYMDIAKYISLLHTSSFRLARADTFEDPYEGLYNEPSVDALRHITPHNPRSADETRRFTRRLEEDKQSTFINCWHWNSKESAAMWKLYSNNDYCIAIVSNFVELCCQLPRHVAFTFVKYIDWESECFEAPNMSQSPYFHKRQEFSHEHEVRIIYMLPLHKTRGGPELDKNDTGLLLPVKLSALVHEVVLAPNTPSWVAEIIRETTNKYNYNFSVRVSSLLRDPRQDR